LSGSNELENNNEGDGMSWKKELKKEDELRHGFISLTRQDLQKLQSLTDDLNRKMEAFKIVGQNLPPDEVLQRKKGKLWEKGLVYRLMGHYSTALSALYDFWNSLDRPTNEG
jgi:hypothetical protein